MAQAGVSRVVIADETAMAAGVSIGMPRREAEGLCPGAVVLDRDLTEEARRFEPILSLVEEVVPRVEVSEPGLIFIPIEGAVRYYGSESQVVDTMIGKLETAELAPMMGLADGPFASYWAARTAVVDTPNIVEDTQRFLGELDVSALQHDDLIATFRWLGVTTLGALAELPRDAVASRFGTVGIEAHRLAHGQDRLVTPRDIPPDLAVEAIYEEPLELVDQVAFTSRTLAARMMEGLRREGIAPHLIEVEVETERGETRSRVWRSADPFTESSLADRVWWQLRSWIESGNGPGGGIVRLRLDPSDLSGDGRQLGLFSDESAKVEAERALARTQTLVGPDSVLEAVPQGGRLPSERVAWRRWGEKEGAVDRNGGAPWPGTTPTPVPALVPDEPPTLDIEWDQGMPVRVRLGSRWEPVLTWSGPWRLSARWWRGEGPADRYQIVTSAGAFLCLVSSNGTSLVGIYD